APIAAPAAVINDPAAAPAAPAVTTVPAVVEAHR
ncbi:hypothetical protein ES5_09093, partial [Dietzia cinnamea P4]